MRVGLAALLLAASLAWPASAVANGDPASDTLLVASIFFPYQGISSDAEAEARQAIKVAKSRGYTIRVALIASKSDLGLVPGLFRKPQSYANLLWRELSFSYRGRVLVVMPNGFGFYAARGMGVRQAHAKIDRIEIGEGPDGLAHAGASAVRVLAGLKPLSPPPSGGGGSSARDRVLIAAGSTVLIVALAFATSRIYRKRRPA